MFLEGHLKGITGISFASILMYLKGFALFRCWLEPRWLPYSDLKPGQQCEDLGPEKTQHWVHDPSAHEPGVQRQVWLERGVCDHQQLWQHCQNMGCKDMASSCHLKVRLKWFYGFMICSTAGTTTRCLGATSRGMGGWLPHAHSTELSNCGATPIFDTMLPESFENTHPRAYKIFL